MLCVKIILIEKRCELNEFNQINRKTNKNNWKSISEMIHHAFAVTLVCMCHVFWLNTVDIRNSIFSSFSLNPIFFPSLWNVCLDLPRNGISHDVLVYFIICSTYNHDLKFVSCVYGVRNGSQAGWTRCGRWSEEFCFSLVILSFVQCVSKNVSKNTSSSFLLRYTRMK